MEMGLGLKDFEGNIRCKKCGARFFKGLKEPRAVCPNCGDVKSDSDVSSSDVSKAKERDEELTV